MAGAIYSPSLNNPALLAVVQLWVDRHPMVPLQIVAPYQLASANAIPVSHPAGPLIDETPTNTE